MYEEDNKIQGENDDGKVNNFKEGSAIEGDVTDGEASDDDEENWIEDEDDTDGGKRDGDKEYCPEKGNDTDSEESYDEEDIVMQDKGRYKKENESSTQSADIIFITQSSVRSKEKVFSAPQAKGLVEMFQDMVSAGKPISKPVIIERLSKNGLSGEYNVEQVVNRLKYERKQHRAKK